MLALYLLFLLVGAVGLGVAVACLAALGAALCKAIVRGARALPARFLFVIPFGLATYGAGLVLSCRENVTPSPDPTPPERVEVRAPTPAGYPITNPPTSQMASVFARQTPGTDDTIEITADSTGALRTTATLVVPDGGIAVDLGPVVSEPTGSATLAAVSVQSYDGDELANESTLSTFSSNTSAQLTSSNSFLSQIANTIGVTGNPRTNSLTVTTAAPATGIVAFGQLSITGAAPAVQLNTTTTCTGGILIGNTDSTNKVYVGGSSSTTNSTGFPVAAGSSWSATGLWTTSSAPYLYAPSTLTVAWQCYL